MTDTPKRRVGRGHPPVEHQWPKGTSGNPLGCPPKRRIADLIDSVEPHAAMMVAHDNKLIERRTNDGTIETLTRREAMLERLYRKGFEGDLRAMKEYLRISEAAQAMARDVHAKMFTSAAAHRSRYLEKFIAAERKGKPLPDVYPDPRDIEIDRDGRVTIHGPVDRAGHLEMQAIVKLRDSAISVLDQFVADPDMDQELRTKAIKAVGKRLRQFNNRLPPRLRKSWVPPDPN